METAIKTYEVRITLTIDLVEVGEQPQVSISTRPKPRPAPFDPAAELVAILGKIKAARLVEVVRAALADPHAAIAAGTLAAIYSAETARATMGRPRSTLLDLLAPYTDVEPTIADISAALLLCSSVILPPSNETCSRTIPQITDLAVLRVVQSVELGRGKAARALVVQLLEERLADLYEGGAS